MRNWIVFGALALAACVDLTEGKAVAEVVEGATPTVAAQAHRSLTVDVGRSHLGLVGAKLTAKHPIHFEAFQGTVGVDEANQPVSVRFVADVASLQSDSARLTKHLKNEDFLWAERYPTAEFASVSVVSGGERGTHTVSGDLTIRGQTQRISFPATVRAGEHGVEASTEFVIDRRDFGVVYPGRPDDLVQDAVLMQIRFVAPSEDTT